MAKRKRTGKKPAAIPKKKAPARAPSRAHAKKITSKRPAPKKRTKEQKKSLVSRPLGPKHKKTTTVKAQRKKVQTSKRASVRRPKTARGPSLSERIAKGAPIFAAFVAQREQVRRLERELEDAKAREYELAERAAVQAEAEASEKKYASDVFVANLRWLRQDASPAMHPSILRHMVEAEEWRRQLHMIGQSDPESKLFKRQAKLIAEEAGVNVKEVYTLWWSP